ncbi:MAG: hypothetical protein LBK06_03690 [Planctomycetaceae bacterium]|nr:hypothetical protein [Planctomycetaceae bacterium]
MERLLKGEAYRPYRLRYILRYIFNGDYLNFGCKFFILFFRGGSGLS